MDRKKVAIQRLVKKLGKGISDSVQRSKKIDDVMKAIHAEGFEVCIAVDGSIALTPQKSAPESAPDEDFIRFMKNLGADC